MRVLFLDDDKNRTAKFKERTMGLHFVVCVETPTEAFEALDRHSRFDVASLDHDLFGKIYQPSDENSGFAVCEHIDLMHSDDRPDKVICHSYNEDGVAAMMALLGGVMRNIVAAPFDSDEYWQNLSGINEIVTV